MLASAPVRAWSDHALCTWAALSVLPEVQRAAPVEAESLEHFLAAEAHGLEQLLADEERWAQQHVPAYPPRPAALVFRADGATPAELRQRFTAAVRINPASRLSLFVQLPPDAAPGNAPLLSEADITPLKDSEGTKLARFAAVSEGQRVPVIDVIASASDEPDYGLDIGLWADNGTAQGRAYGFGKQPFGNPAMENSSQGPLHIGFYHEAGIVYRAAPFLGRTLPEYRIHLWQTLARHALRTGHPYWGWRFAGWSLHHVQDLTQPYHARVLPGVGVMRMLWVNTLDIAGLHGAKSDAISRVSNRHYALENFQLHLMRAAYLAPRPLNPAAAALLDTTDDGQAVFDDTAPRERITQEAFDASDAIDAALVATVPARVVSDPAYVFGKTEPTIDLNAELAKASPERHAALAQALAPLLHKVGMHSRAFVRALLRPPG